MKKYDKLEVSESYYETLKEIQLKNGTPIREQHIGSRKKLYAHNNVIATVADQANLQIGEISKHQFVSFLGLFNKTLYKQFLSNPHLYDLNVKYEGAARKKNKEAWDKIEVGMFFYNVDLSSAYWQMAHKLGYIDDKLFEKYIDQDQYKNVKRFCISFLARPNKMTYKDGENEWEIVCDTSVLINVYLNIRYELYNTIQEAISKVENYLEYNIDGVTVISEEVDVVKEFFKSKGLKFKITECKKISETDFLYAGRTRIFKRV